MMNNKVLNEYLDNNYEHLTSLFSMNEQEKFYKFVEEHHTMIKELDEGI